MNSVRTQEVHIRVCIISVLVELCHHRHQVFFFESISLLCTEALPHRSRRGPLFKNEKRVKKKKSEAVAGASAVVVESAATDHGDVVGEEEGVCGIVKQLVEARGKKRKEVWDFFFSIFCQRSIVVLVSLYVLLVVVPFKKKKAQRHKRVFFILLLTDRSCVFRTQQHCKVETTLYRYILHSAKVVVGRRGGDARVQLSLKGGNSYRSPSCPFPPTPLLAPSSTGRTDGGLAPPQGAAVLAAVSPSETTIRSGRRQQQQQQQQHPEGLSPLKGR